jgi:hypothetical protein
MAQLSSPGVSVTVIDESFYTPGAPGTVPLIVVASASNKMNSAGTGIAAGTKAANAGKVWLLTSQMDLGTTFGIPYFQTDAENNPVNAGELNEYGLQAAYSFLGVSNRAYVVRADVDTSQLHARANAPTGLPMDGTYWLDIADSNFGVFEWNADAATATNGQSFEHQGVSVVTDSALVSNGGPIASYGQIGEYALVATETTTTLWFKKYATDGILPAGKWVQVGSDLWKASWPSAPGGPGVGSLGYTAPTVFQGHISGTTLTVTSSDPLPTIPAGGLMLTSTIQAGNFVSNHSYKIAILGNTNWHAIGASSTPTVGETFTASGVGSGSGTATTAGFIAQTTVTGIINAGAKTYTVTSYPSLFPSTGEATFYIANPATDTLTINGAFVQIQSNSLSSLATTISSEFAHDGITAGVDKNGYLNIYSNGPSFTLGGTAVPKLGMQSVTYRPPSLQIAPHTSIPRFKTLDGLAYRDSIGGGTPAPSGSVWVKSTAVNQGANWVIKKYVEATNSWVQQPSKLFANSATALATLDPKGGGANLTFGALYIKYNILADDPQIADFTIYARNGAGAMNIRSVKFTDDLLSAGSNSFTVGYTIPGVSAVQGPVTVTFTATAGDGSGSANARAFSTAFTGAISDANIRATLNSDNSITITHLAGGDIYLTDVTGGPISTLYGDHTNVYDDPTNPGVGYICSLWTSTVNGMGFVTPSVASPVTDPADQTLWYNSDITEVDIMVNAGPGQGWVGYLTTVGQTVVNPGVGFASNTTSTDPAGPIVSATKPKVRSDGKGLNHGDIWVSTADIENFPTVYKFNFLTKKWVMVDTADGTTSEGMVFGDARWNDNSALSAPQTGAGAPDSIVSLLSSSYVDPDVLDPALFPTGMLLWNLRRSGYNVKKYVKNAIDTQGLNHQFLVDSNPQPMTNYYPDRWVTAAANQIDGAGTFGRKAQRAVVLQALQATIQENQNIRQPDTVIYNLLSCPGYLETLSSLIGLNTDNGQSAFIVADSPARLTPDATSLSNWGNNTMGAAIDGEAGLIATNSYAAVYYPWAYTQDLTGNNVVVPPSHVMLRTIALSDNVSYPWFAPAGVRRGGVTNASSVGYVDGQTGEYHTVALNGGQRDTLAGIHVNPITYLAGTGLVCYGQYTRQLVASSLDRINVARLVIYLRYQLNKIAKPFIFEPNDTITRNEIKQQIENMLLELTGQRALYDFIVICDKSNNTPSRIDRNELHVDIAIEPVKSVEFIYIPMRLEKTGAIAGLGA